MGEDDMSKIKPETWSISYWSADAIGDEASYTAQYEYRDKNGKHEVSNDFATYSAAYGWLAERIQL